MEESSPVIYGLEFQARALTAHTAEMDEIRFFVGTQSLRFENQVHQIDFDDENNIINKNVYLHPEGEIWQISASPSDKSIIATIYNKATDAKAEMQGALWKIPGDFDSSVNEDATTNAPCLEKITSISSPEHGDLKSLLWHPSEQCTDIITLADNHILKWDTAAEARISSTACLGGKGQPRFTTGKWNPHHNASQIATANENCIRGWDLRTMSQCYHIDNAHGQLVRDLDFNPNKQYYLASCGDDCKARFWDTRKTTEPVKVLADHSHWIWSIRYNHFHDQLVLTSSSDSRVILTNTASISSEPFGQLAEEEEDEDEERVRENKVLEDGIISSYEEHEDSVYAVEWSTADPWLFASLSYDGRVVINRVPRNIKYQILL